MLLACYRLSFLIHMPHLPSAATADLRPKSCGGPLPLPARCPLLAATPLRQRRLRPTGAPCSSGWQRRAAGPAPRCCPRQAAARQLPGSCPSPSATAASSSPSARRSAPAWSDACLSATSGCPCCGAAAGLSWKGAPSCCLLSVWPAQAASPSVAAAAKACCLFSSCRFMLMRSVVVSPSRCVTMLRYCVQQAGPGGASGGDDGADAQPGRKSAVRLLQGEAGAAPGGGLR